MRFDRSLLQTLVDGLGKQEEAGDGPRPAAVLVPIVWDPDSGQDRILLTKRTDHVQTHKGQVSFPGGMWEAGDADLRATALREAEEEIGLRADHVLVVGRLPLVRTRGALPIIPWVGVIEKFPDLRLNGHEVERTLWLPLRRLLEEGLREVTVPMGSAQFQSVAIDVDGELVWGATARILETLATLLKKQAVD